MKSLAFDWRRALLYARDGSGTFSLASAAFTPGTTIESAKMNADLTDIAAGITQPLSKDGQTTPTANLPMGGFKFTGLGPGTGSGESIRYEQHSQIRKSLIYGWTYANSSGDATNDIDIAAGGGSDSTGASWIEGGAMTKRLDALWVAGNNQGGLDTGSIANTDYYIWAIGGPAVTSDYVFSTASTIGAVTLPTGFNYGRPFGWFKRVGGTIVAFHAYETDGGGIEFKWDSPTQDVALANTLTTTRRTDAVKVPLNFSVLAIVRTELFDASATAVARISCPDETDAAVGSGSVPGPNMISTTVYIDTDEKFIRTSATGTVASRANLATVDSYFIYTVGFRWARRP